MYGSKIRITSSTSSLQDFIFELPFSGKHHKLFTSGKMKFALLAALLVLAGAASLSNAASLPRNPRQLVPTEFKNINMENYLKNPRSVQFQLKCIVYDGPCDRIGKYLKVTLPEIITGSCGHCSPSDRQAAGRLVAHIQKNFPKEWHDAIKKYQGGQVVKPSSAEVSAVESNPANGSVRPPGPVSSA